MLFRRLSLTFVVFVAATFLAWSMAMLTPAGAEPAVTDPVLADFEAGLPAGFGTFNGASSITAIPIVITDGAPLALPGQVGDNAILEVVNNVTDYAGYQQTFAQPQDWSGFTAFSFWFYGSNSGRTYQAELFDNRSNPDVDTSERFDFNFVDNFTGWQEVSIPFASFNRATDYQPGGAPNDGFTQTEIWGYGMVLVPGNTTFYVDNYNLVGDVNAIQRKVTFSGFYETTGEDEAAVVEVSLNLVSTQPITVTYATSDGTATAGSDYTATSGQLVFAPGDTVLTFTVPVADDSSQEDDETVHLTLSAPVNAIVGPRTTIDLTITDNDQATPTNNYTVVVDDYEYDTLPTGTDTFGVGIGYNTWNDGAGSGVGLTLPVVADSDPLARPGQPPTTTLLQVDHNIVQWGGFTHAFEDEAVTEWVTEDWSSYEGVGFWFYGNATSGLIQLDLLDNRGTNNSDSAERWYYRFEDDTAGWKWVAIPFGDFQRRTDWQPGGAPDDGLTLTEVHGYALGFPVGNETSYLDDFSLLMQVDVIDDFEEGLPTGTDSFGVGIGFNTWQDGAGSSVTLSENVEADNEPLARPGQPVTTTLLQIDHNIIQWGGWTHAFENEAVTEWVTQDWSGYEGLSFWFYGNNTSNLIQVDLLDNRGTNNSDSAERWYYRFADDTAGWQLVMIPFGEFQRRTDWQPGGAPNDGLTLTEVHGYAIGFPVGNHTSYMDDVALYGNSGEEPIIKVGFAEASYNVMEGDETSFTVELSGEADYPITVDYATQAGTATAERDYLTVSGTLNFAAGEITKTVTVEFLDDPKHEGTETLSLVLSDPISVELGLKATAQVVISETDTADPLLINDFETSLADLTATGGVTVTGMEVMTGTAEALPGQWTYENLLHVEYDIPSTMTETAGFSENFVLSQDWSDQEGVTFWYYGQNSGNTITFELQDNAAPDTGPAGWQLVWSDEFDGPAGSLPNPDYWTPVIGDGTAEGIPGWGNAEREYYTADPENLGLDGAGSLVITAQEEMTPTTEYTCYYGACEYTSARLVTTDKVEVQYGRIEARLKLPYGQGIWPAFWTLGTDIAEVGWPMCGEIDIMENVGFEPSTAHGTVHGPGYSGGSAVGGGYTLPGGEVFSDDFHTFAIEWEEDVIRWYVDGNLYFTVTPDDVPGEWVYNHQFYLLLNLAVGGYWPGYPDETTVFPQTYHIDYVRVYQTPNTAERFTATFEDNFTGWQQVTIPFEQLERSAIQPEGAPNDGLTLTEVWGYGMQFAAGDEGEFYLDQVRLVGDIPAYPAYLPVIFR